MSYLSCSASLEAQLEFFAVCMLVQATVVASAAITQIDLTITFPTFNSPSI
jgi:hypothetical protein